MPGLTWLGRQDWKLALCMKWRGGCCVIRGQGCAVALTADRVMSLRSRRCEDRGMDAVITGSACVCCSGGGGCPGAREHVCGRRNGRSTTPTRSELQGPKGTVLSSRVSHHALLDVLLVCLFVVLTRYHHSARHTTRPVATHSTSLAIPLAPPSPQTPQSQIMALLL